MVPIVVLLIRITVTRGFDDRNEGMCAASRVITKSANPVCESYTSSLPIRTGAIGSESSNAVLCVCVRACGFECGGSGSGAIVDAVEVVCDRCLNGKLCSTAVSIGVFGGRGGTAGSCSCCMSGGTGSDLKSYAGLMKPRCGCNVL